MMYWLFAGQTRPTRLICQTDPTEGMRRNTLSLRVLRAFVMNYPLLSHASRHSQ